MRPSEPGLHELAGAENALHRSLSKGVFAQAMTLAALTMSMPYRPSLSPRLTQSITCNPSLTAFVIATATTDLSPSGETITVKGRRGSPGEPRMQKPCSLAPQQAN